MNRTLTYRLGLRARILPLLGGFLCLYFSFHLIHGDRSVLKYFSTQEQIAQAQIQQEKLIAQRSALEEKVKRMRPGSMTKAMLEERVRLVLGYRAPDETTVVSQ